MISATSDLPRTALRDWLADSSVWLLIAVNAIALALALYQHWSLTSLLWLYWAQSVVIGIANVFRILSLDKFSSEGFTVNGESEPTPQLQRRTAGFFAVHYGLFHVIYLGFIFGFGRGAAIWNGWFALCTALFALNHLWSYRRNRELDRQGTPNIGALMFMPYVRIVPMHATILSGALFAPAGIGLVFFVVLKTAADVALHIAEHALLRKAGPPVAAAAAGAAPLRAPPRS